jgi:hypothetical protein
MLSPRQEYSVAMERLCYESIILQKSVVVKYRARVVMYSVVEEVRARLQEKAQGAVQTVPPNKQIGSELLSPHDSDWSQSLKGSRVLFGERYT